jgi:hypothetical protein
MMKTARLFMTAIFFQAGIMTASAQDLHFSQFFNSPLTTNPANTGFIPDGDYRLGVNFRNQWASVMPLPYRTVSAFGDVQVMKDKFENGWFSPGCSRQWQFDFNKGLRIGCVSPDAGLLQLVEPWLQRWLG